VKAVETCGDCEIESTLGTVESRSDSLPGRFRSNGVLTNYGKALALNPEDRDAAESLGK